MYLIHGSRFDDAPFPHDHHPLAQLADQRQIVADHDQRHTGALVKFAQQPDDLRLDRYVERGRRFIGDDQFWTARKCPSDAHALALTARQLMRVARQHEGRQTHHVEQFPHRHTVVADRFRQRRGNRLARVQRIRRALEHHLHALTKRRVLRPRHRVQRVASETDRAGSRRSEADHHASDSRFAAAAFADDSERLALRHLERHAGHRMKAAPVEHALERGTRQRIRFADFLQREDRLRGQGGVRHFRHQVEVVRDEHEAEIHLVHQRSQQLDDLRLHGHVQRGGGFVREQQRRLADNRGGNHRALLHAAAQFVRIGALRGARVFETDACEHGMHFVAYRAAAQQTVRADHVGELRADREGGVERRCWILKDHGDAPSAQCPHARLRRMAQVFAVEHDPPAADAPRVAEQAEHRQRGYALARTRFADETDRLAASHLQIEPIQQRFVHRDAPGTLAACALRRRGSRIVRIESPNRLKASTLTNTAAPGNAETHQLRLHAEPDETERRFHDDRHAEQQRRLNQHRRDDVGQNVGEHDARPARALQNPCGDILRLRLGLRETMGEPRETRRVQHADQQHQFGFIRNREHAEM
ncbi:hypothetical protein KCU90_g3480, partial [Aureobasidium melanogenum]